MSPAAAKVMGATFSLAICLLAVAFVVWALVAHMPAIAPVAGGLMAAIAAVMVKSDWSTVWGPLLSRIK